MFLKLCTLAVNMVLLMGMMNPLEAFSISLGFGVQPVVRPLVMTRAVPVVQPIVQPVVQPVFVRQPIYQPVYQPVYQPGVLYAHDDVDAIAWQAPVYTGMHAPVYTSPQHKRHHRSHCSFGMQCLLD